MMPTGAIAMVNERDSDLAKCHTELEAKVEVLLGYQTKIPHETLTGVLQGQSEFEATVDATRLICS